MGFSLAGFARLLSLHVNTVVYWKHHGIPRYAELVIELLEHKKLNEEFRKNLSDQINPIIAYEVSAN